MWLQFFNKRQHEFTFCICSWKNKPFIKKSQKVFEVVKFIAILIQICPWRNFSDLQNSELHIKIRQENLFANKAVTTNSNKWHFSSLYLPGFAISLNKLWNAKTCLLEDYTKFFSALQIIFCQIGIVYQISPQQFNWTKSGTYYSAIVPPITFEQTKSLFFQCLTHQIQQPIPKLGILCFHKLFLTNNSNKQANW